VDRVDEFVDCADSVHCGPAAIAALGSSPELGLRPLRCLRALTEGRVRGRAGRRTQWRGFRSSGSGRGAAQKDDGEGAVRARRGGVGGVGGFTVGGVGFYRAEARRGRDERLQLLA
jgi:hypothetical protein